MNTTNDINRLLVDVDGTLCQNLPRICEYVEMEYGVSTLPSEVDEWMYEFDEVGVTVGEVAAKLLEDLPEWYLEHLSPLPGACDGLRRLSDAGVEIAIVTHRNPETHAFTRDWLDRHDLVYDEYVEDVPDTKAVIDGDALVDDYHGNISDAVDAGMAGILIDHPYNSPLSSPRAAVAESWDEVVNLVLADGSFLRSSE